MDRKVRFDRHRFSHCRNIIMVSLLLFLQMSPCLADQRIKDSLVTALKTATTDTVRVKLLNQICYEYIELSNYSGADSLLNIAVKIEEEAGLKKQLARSIDLQGVVQQQKGEFTRSIELFNKAMALNQELHDTSRIAKEYNGIGISFYQLSNYPEGCDNFLKALALYKKIKNDRGIAGALCNVGIFYDDQDSLTKALECYNKALSIFRHLADSARVPGMLTNIGVIYKKMKDYTMAQKYYRQALKIFQSTGNRAGEASTLTNIGGIYSTLNNDDSALVYFNKEIDISNQIGDKDGLVTPYLDIADIYFDGKEYKKALDYALKGIEFAKEVGWVSSIAFGENEASKIYEKLGDQKQALLHYKAGIKAGDSVNNLESAKKLVRSEMNYKFQEQQAIEKENQEKKDALQQEKDRRQILFICLISGVLLLVMWFAFYAYRSYSQKQKANKELDEKNHKIAGAYAVIEEKNKEITDSINYAKRIQWAMLPESVDMKKYLPESFVLFVPKAIVSGDFYFYDHLVTPGSKDLGEVIFIAAADCTGHGVPGAFMSMIGAEKLHYAVEASRNPGQALAHLNRSIKSSLHQSTDTDSTRDGMDIALCAITRLTPQTFMLEYAGANRPLWIIRKDTTVIEEIKATKKAIGGFTDDKEKFNTWEFQLKEGDSFYIFSDGYADQFGGEQGKKLTTKKFRELLLSVCHKPMAEQHDELKSFIQNWRGTREQLDDILVIGARV